MEDKYSHYIVGVANGEETIEYSFPKAKIEYLPDPGNPTILMVITPCSTHQFIYHAVNYCYISEGDKQPRMCRYCGGMEAMEFSLYCSTDCFFDAMPPK